MTTPFNLLSSPFSIYVREILKLQFSFHYANESDRVAFAFEKKWIPDALKEEKTSHLLFERYKQDIINANQWRESTVSVKSDKAMAIGMTWFMVIFKLKESYSLNDKKIKNNE
jgi:hypothetical protein